MCTASLSLLEFSLWSRLSTEDKLAPYININIKIKTKKHAVKVKANSLCTKTHVLLRNSSF